MKLLTHCRWRGELTDPRWAIDGSGRILSELFAQCDIEAIGNPRYQELVWPTGLRPHLWSRWLERTR